MRHEGFFRKTGALALGIFLLLPGARTTGAFAGLVETNAPAIRSAKPADTRSFRMGFTGFVWDMSSEAVTATRKFTREHGDIIAHHIEGVPWAEAFRGQPLPPKIVEEWEGKKKGTPH